MTDTTAGATRFYAVVLNYDATYHRNEIVEASSVADACQLAMEAANGNDSWQSYDDVGPTYVARAVARDTEEQAENASRELMDLVGEDLPFDCLGPYEQIDFLKEQVSDLQADAERLHGVRRASVVMLLALRDAEEFIAGFEGDETQTGLGAKLDALRAAIDGAAAAGISTP